MDDATAMRRALALAQHGWGRVAPNPLVGAVVLQRHEVVGEGWHAEYGEAHAERMALARAGELARGGTLVCTLEPCAHTGKQPPCTEAILAAGIARVVFAVDDPNPLAAGGAARLRAAGLEVVGGVEAEAARAQLAPFLHAQRGTGRPFVALKLAQSLDGRIADATLRSQWLSGPEARAWAQWLRAGYDAIGVGSRTALADDPLLTVRGEVTPRVPPMRVVFDRGLALARGSRLVQSVAQAPVLLVGVPDADPERARLLGEAGVTVLRAATLPEALRLLHAEHGIGSLLVEGGGRLAGALLADGLVDRLHLVTAPVWLGEQGIPAFAGHPSYAIADAPRWRVVERRPLGADSLLVADRDAAP
ncbi:MAG: bifunctional diaminohydroxyphosphoribosylaminopyrimidine deaminase/5-amino-6-(5-phosphoribosylamino)uracil reductase RibD [Gemmatimonadales bacterium]|nr:bifunctional diaminohydroxyphosphoribosylaminopyrimidine deaminase/5-amino-6-(5-phosphoribosylamino)uracil reductase RibD [Gemmatimonadales bacterium]